MKVTNQQRTWYATFAIWCLKYGKDYRTEDFNQVKTIPDEEYQELQKKAIFHILNSGHCASCWEPIDAAPRICSGGDASGEHVGEVALVCPHCKLMYTVSPTDRTSDWVDA